MLFFFSLFFLILGSMGDTTRARLLGTSRSAVLFLFVFLLVSFLGILVYNIQNEETGGRACSEPGFVGPYGLDMRWFPLSEHVGSELCITNMFIFPSDIRSKAGL